MARTFGSFTQVNTVPSDFLVGYRGNEEIRTNLYSLSSSLNLQDLTSVYAAVNVTSGAWNSVYTSVQSLSDGWEETVTIAILQASSGRWDSVYASVCAASANWNAAYNVINAGGQVGGSLIVDGNITPAPDTTYNLVSATDIIAQGTLSGKSLSLFDKSLDTSEGAVSAGFININVNGTPYKIQIWNV